MPDPTCNSEKSANGGNKQILLLLNIIIKLRHQVIHGKQRKAKLRKRKTRASRENKDKT